MKCLAFLLLIRLVSAVALNSRRLAGTRILHNTYIVKFKDDTSSTDVEQHFRWIQSFHELNSDGSVARGVRHKFSLAFQGYSAVLDDRTLNDVLYRPEVADVDVVGLSTPPTNYKSEETNSVRSNARFTASTDDVINNLGVVAIQNRGWNANRVSHREFDGGYQPGPWLHDRYLGEGVSVYVLDTGVRVDHPGFSGSNVTMGANFVDNTEPTDVQGHGTMCAGVIAGDRAGLAPAATTYGVKIANDDNRSACDDVVAGIEFVLRQPGPNNMKVITMSQSGFLGQPNVSWGVSFAVAMGVHFVVAAGNSGQDACMISPSDSPGAIVVGSVDGFNRLPRKPDSLELSNVGKCVTVFAPGARVPSLGLEYMDDPNVETFAWGTSVAAPQVAALIANRLSKVGPTTPWAMKAWLESESTRGQMNETEGLMGAPNLIVFNGVEDEIPPAMGASKGIRPGRLV